MSVWQRIAVAVVFVLVGVMAWAVGGWSSNSRDVRTVSQRLELPRLSARLAAPSPARHAARVEKTSLPLGAAVEVPGMEVLDGDSVQLAARAVVRRSPAAVRRRLRSETEFAGLSRARVASVLHSVLPALVARSDDEQPVLASGQSVVGYRSPFLAETRLSPHQRGLVASLAPMAKKRPGGSLVPIDLSLSPAAAGVLEPRETSAPVQIPTNIQHGVDATVAGVSLVPIEAGGSPIADAGESDGASVLYPNTALDSDTLAKPTSSGFELATIMRAPASPRVQRYLVTGPSGLQLVQHQPDGPVEVLTDGVHVGVIAPASATDAAGAAVPVSMSVEGTVLSVTVAPNVEETQWPVVVDPTWYYVNDSTLPDESEPNTNWKPFKSTDVGLNYGPTPGAWIEGNPSNAGEAGGLQYPALGDTHIYYVEDTTSASLEPTGTDTIQAYGGGSQNYGYISEGANYTGLTDDLCVINSYPCYPEYGAGENKNLVEIYASAGLYSPGHRWWFDIGTPTKVYMAEEHGTEAYFNTTSPTIAESGNRTNVLAGPNRWMGVHSGAFEVVSKNPGMGIAGLKVEEEGGGSFKAEVNNHVPGECHGEQCPEVTTDPFSYNSGLAEGNDKIHFYAVGSDNSSVQETAIVKVDAKPPEHIEVTGWPENKEIGTVPAALTVKATDGIAPTPSSGVKTLELSIDGQPPKVLPEASCAPGPCTAQGTYTLSTGNLAEGVHRLVVTAVDAAGNESLEQFTFDVRRPTAMAAGPGSVEPTSGQLELSATDASLSAGTGVSRTYRSREIPAAQSGPLGPQWSLSLGGSERLVASPNGSVTLSAAERGRTTFEPKAGGLEFESPEGDSNLKLTAKEAKSGEGITEYVMSDSRAGTSVSYTQPAGMQETAPEFALEFGAEGVTMKPGGIAIDKNNDEWVTDAANSRLLMFNAAGELKGQAGQAGSKTGEMRTPGAIVINQSTGTIYVADEGNERIDEFNSEGHSTGSFGTQIIPAGLALDSSGDVLIANNGNRRLEEYKSNGEHITTIGSTGQFAEMAGIAYESGDVYVVEPSKSRVQVVTTGGSFVREIGAPGSGAGALTKPSGIVVEPSTGRIYVSDLSTGLVKEYSSTGTYIASFGKSGTEPGEFSQPNAIAIGARNQIYVTDQTTDLIEAWGRDTWLPTKDEGAVHTVAGSDDYIPIEFEPGRTELLPTELLGPTPPGVTCGTKPEELKNGCRALLLEYTTSTGTATGEAESEWGTYKGRLHQVSLEAYNPASKKMEVIPVADYAFDGHGRLRAEWDPRVTPKPLKTKYGYDEEGQVTALTPPGLQTWEFSYGTTATDTTPGRLLKITRGPANSEIWSGAAPSNTEGPVITGTAAVGETLKVSTGKWSNEPAEALAYAYQWERCTETGTECTAIPGAVNQTYTPIVPDAKHTLIAKVLATNGAGTRTATAAKTAVVSGAVFALVENIGSSGTAGGKFSEPTAVAVAPGGDVWVADPGNHRLQEFSPAGQFMAAVGWGVSDGKEEFERCTSSCRAGLSGGGAGEFTDPEGIGINPETGRLYVGDDGQSRIDVLTSTGVPLSTFAYYGTYEHLKEPHGVTVAPNGNVVVADTGNGNIVEFNPEGEYIATYGKPGTGAGEFEGVTGVAVVGTDVYATDVENEKVKEFELEGNHQLVTEFGKTGSNKGEFTYPWAITYDPLTEKLMVSSYGDGRIESYSLTGTPGEEFGHQGSASTDFDGPSGIAINPATGAAYIADELNNRVDEWAPGGIITEPTQPAPSTPRGSVTTFDYNIPTSGTGIEHPLTPAETKKWGQENDLPVEGTAIFPPDKPMGWPAANYEGATIVYLDSRSRTVNEVSRAGGVSTTEYNNQNLITRTLTPANRELALTHGEGSAAFSRLIDTENTYNSAGLLTETLGPEHKVEIVHGHEGKSEETRARERTSYTYEEASGLPIKEEDVAVNSAKEEFDKRTTTKSYSGQEGLGYELRKPTSVTVDPEGLDLTTTTKYSPESGQVIAVRSPGKSTNNAPLYAWAFGTKGTGAAQINSPASVTVDGSDNVWVADTLNNRIDEYTNTGVFEKAVGWGVATGAEALETCTTECKQGIPGKGSGQFNAPAGIAYNPSSKTLYVSDTGNNRIELMTTKGAFKRAFGTTGSGTGQLNKPLGLVAKANGTVVVADSGNHRLESFNEKGEASETFASGKGEFTDVALCGENESILYATDPSTRKVDQIEGNTITRTFGGTGKEGGDIGQVGGLACDPASQQLYITDSERSQVDIYSLTGSFINAFGSEGTGTGYLKEPSELTVTATGATYIIDAGNSRISEWTPGSEGAREQITNYYSAGSESPIKACRNHPEWADLACQTEPAEQPGTTNTPALPVTTSTYNIYQEPEVVMEVFGSASRTKSIEYDGAGRIKKSSTTGTSGLALPPVSDEYNQATGELETLKATSEGKTETETTKHNSVGAIISYTDATGVESTFEYESGGDARLIRYSDGKGEQTYQYNGKTGARTTLHDSAIGEVTATYNIEGEVSTETLPDKLVAKRERDETGAIISIRYEKTVDCAKTCPEVWYSENRTSTIHGEAASESSTLANYTYSHDGAGHLLEAIEQPAAGGCRIRLYGYDEPGNRTEETKRETSANTCPAEGGTSTTHLYDSAGQLADPGVAYDPYGDTTNLPATDGEGHLIASSYYVDSALAASTQNGHTLTYTYDPSGREKELDVTGSESSTTIQHYSTEGRSPSWSEEGSKWTRRVPGIAGELLALAPSIGAATLEIQDLHGDIVATAGTSETEQQLKTTFPTTEFGQPASQQAPPQSSWLAESGFTSQYTKGISMSTVQGAAYIPQLGRNLQVAEVEPPGACPTGCGNAPPREPTLSLAGVEYAEAIGRQIIAEEEAARQKAREEEAGGDPCSSIFEQEKLSSSILHIVNTEFAAWTDIEYCWGGSSGLRVHMKYQRQRQKSNVVEIFSKWEDSAGWIDNNSLYWVERTIKFSWKTPCVLHGPICGPWGSFTIRFDFWFSPSGAKYEETSWEKEWF